MIILYPGYSLQSFAGDLTESEANEILSAYTALFHPAIFQHFNKIPQWESASSISPDGIAKLILIPPCCESFLSQEFDNIESESQTVIIRNLKSRNEIVNEIIKRFDIKHNFENEFIAGFYALGTTALFVNLLAHRLHYMDSVNDSSIIQAFQDLIENVNNKKSKTAQTDDTNIIETINQTKENYKNNLFESETFASGLFRDAFERICETKECYYPISSYLIDLTLVVKSTLGEPFRRLLSSRECVNIFMPSLLLESLSEMEPDTFEVLKSAVDSGKVDFVADDVSETSLLLLPILDAANSILQGVSIYREQLGISPTIYGRHRAGLAPFLPQILKLLGFKGVLYFAPFDGWFLKKRSHSKMIWEGVDGTKIDALIRYPVNCTTSKEFFDFADHYSDVISGDSSPTAVFAEFPVDKTNKIKSEKITESDSESADNFCNDNSADTISDSVDSVDWCNDLRLLSKYTTQLGEFVKLGSYFATTSRTGLEESISAENYIVSEPSDIPFWLRVYRENLSRLVISALGTASQVVDQKFTGKPVFDSIRDSVAGFISAVGLNVISDQCSANGEIASVGTNTDVSTKVNNNNNSQCGRRGIVIVNAWNFVRRVFVDVSDWSGLPAAVSPIVFAEEASGKKEIVVEVPPLGYVLIPEPEVAPKNDLVQSIKQEQKQEQEKPQEKTRGKLQVKQIVKKPHTSKTGWNIISGLFVKKSKPALITKSEDQNAFFLQNEYFVARIDSNTGMLRSLFTGNYRYNRLSQQLGFRQPKALRELDSRLANDPNRGYANSVVDEISIEASGSVTGILKICGRLVCNDGCTAAKFTELITICRYSRILEFSYEIEPMIEPSGDSAWDSYYAIRSAWNDNSLELRGSLGDGIYNTTTNRVLSPRFVDLRTDKHAITFFSEGLPFHRRFSGRYLDTILIAQNDNKYDTNGNKIDTNNTTNPTQNSDNSSDNSSNNSSNNSSGDSGRVVRRFRFGVGIDIQHPLLSSLEFMLNKDEFVKPVWCEDNNVVSRWLFRLDTANIVVLHWEPIYGSGNVAETAAENNLDKNEMIGFKVYLLETEGVQANGVLRSFKPIINSHTTNLLNEELKKLNINEAGVQITLHPHELLPLVCLFR
ncbi:MAG: hypothetical protein LBK06_05535 [Planctomycetaceae bacterium]|jgi:hypothetical protein|nr:hypothetical protein [Planctomycetaceae bacterium]